MSSNLCEVIKSVGIDIGTTTTQFIISELTVKNVAPGSLVPRMEITDKVVIYRSDIHFTPIKDNHLVDSDGIFALIAAEFEKSGIAHEEINTGAVIITGETAKKENAKSVSSRISIFSGDFVVATAGGKLESVIAGKGSGASSYSKNNFSTVANIDVGGGTTNVGIFNNGKAVDSCCINVGGRLLQVCKDRGVVTNITEPMKAIIKDCGLDVALNEKVSLRDLETICKRMAEVVVEHVVSSNLAGLAQKLLMTTPLTHDYEIATVMISGGVADSVYNNPSINSVKDVAVYGDIGPMLGSHLSKTFGSEKFDLVQPTETIRATVIGAGSQTVDVSGSTILVNDEVLPLKNVPVVLPFVEDVVVDADIISREIKRSIDNFYEEDDLDNIAIAFQGSQYFSFKDVTVLAEGIYAGFEKIRKINFPVVVVLEHDIGKVLGQSLKVLDNDFEIICVDQIVVDEGDYIDIGNTVAGGTVVPVVIKTLIFETEQI